MKYSSIEIARFKFDRTKDTNYDVFVFVEGKDYVATFFTYQNISSIIEKNKETGECLNGQYFWASDMILVAEITYELVEKVIIDMLEDGSFYSAFTLWDESEDDYDE